MRKPTLILATTSVFALLSACVGSSSGGVTATGGGTTGGVGTTAPSYEKLDSTAAVTSTLGGVSFRSNGTSGALDIVTTSGAVTHNTGNTTVTDGTYSLTDPDGFNSNGRLTDGTSTIISDGKQGFTGTYEYVTVYEQSYTSGGINYDSAGIGGVITNASDVPTSGNATYTGEAVGTVVTSGRGFDLKGGTSSVIADFAAGKVNATMTGFTATDQATGNATVAPIDTITATGMTIAGNRFSGGTTTTTNGGAAVNVTGPNTSTTAQGAFFGYNGTQTATSGTIAAPDEVGGIVLLRGNNGYVVGGFVAD